MNRLSKDSAALLEVDENSAGQRVDNYLTKLLKGVPKSHVYRILRSGQVRVNSRRVDHDYRLNEGDRLRIPPIRTARREETRNFSSPRPADFAILHEDAELLVIDKPAGIAVHGGSGISLGVIEQLRRDRPQARFLELVHRLDRGTSGVLLLAKKRPALAALHEQLRLGRARKFYLALVSGRWRNKKHDVRLPLNKYVLPSGERRVSVAADGAASHTIFRLKQSWRDFSLIEAELRTGRTHQIRVHLKHLGFPIAGDDKYGDFALNKALMKKGLRRMFLHAYKVVVAHPRGATMTFESPLPPELRDFVESLSIADSCDAEML